MGRPAIIRAAAQQWGVRQVQRARKMILRKEAVMSMIQTMGWVLLTIQRYSLLIKKIIPTNTKIVP